MHYHIEQGGYEEIATESLRTCTTSSRQSSRRASGGNWSRAYTGNIRTAERTRLHPEVRLICLEPFKTALQGKGSWHVNTMSFQKTICWIRSWKQRFCFCYDMHGMAEQYKSDLKKEMQFFSNVEELDPNTILWSAIRFQRNNNTYRMLISLCQLILEGMAFWLQIPGNISLHPSSTNKEWAVCTKNLSLNTMFRSVHR